MYLKREMVELRSNRKHFAKIGRYYADWWWSGIAASHARLLTHTHGNSSFSLSAKVSSSFLLFLLSERVSLCFQIWQINFIWTNSFCERIPSMHTTHDRTMVPDARSSSSFLLSNNAIFASERSKEKEIEQREIDGCRRVFRHFCCRCHFYRSLLAICLQLFPYYIWIVCFGCFRSKKVVFCLFLCILKNDVDCSWNQSLICWHRFRLFANHITEACYLWLFRTVGSLSLSLSLFCLSSCSLKRTYIPNGHQ